MLGNFPQSHKRLGEIVVDPLLMLLLRRRYMVSISIFSALQPSTSRGSKPLSAPPVPPQYAEDDIRDTGCLARLDCLWLLRLLDEGVFHVAAVVKLLPLRIIARLQGKARCEEECEQAC